jgi:hypothetical protein
LHFNSYYTLEEFFKRWRKKNHLSMVKKIIYQKYCSYDNCDPY